MVVECVEWCSAKVVLCWSGALQFHSGVALYSTVALWFVGDAS